MIEIANPQNNTTCIKNIHHMFSSITKHTASQKAENVPVTPIPINSQSIVVRTCSRLNPILPSRDIAFERFDLSSKRDLLHFKHLPLTRIIQSFHRVCKRFVIDVVAIFIHVFNAKFGVTKETKFVIFVFVSRKSLFRE